ncbi:hypothetical protein B0T14DRAFT_570781 [Immersiella caudata]|uniref:Uncharacterized protein n=1 Tax=Immersiella caudata TaxID=314043 RepID=A0AA39TKQ3_9PEZI|nr:hypothetical protein B0T14DRAFT_570781 [Immersiella caudata]
MASSSLQLVIKSDAQRHDILFCHLSQLRGLLVPLDYQTGSSMMFLRTLIAALALILGAHAAIIDFFQDSNCTVPAGNRNLWDNSCAQTGAFESVRITYPGGSDQHISCYSRNACAGDITSSCLDATSVGVCVSAYNDAGASNAISSYAGTCSTPLGPPGGPREKKEFQA